MKNMIVFLMLLLAACSTTNTELFNGKDLTGWEGSTEFFRVEKEAIVGGNLDRAIPENQFLCTEESFEDFELTLEVKFIPDNNNGGIQIRSKRIPDNHEVIGYQVDVGYDRGNPIWGFLYDESRRNRFIATADTAQIARLLNREGFNDYKIRCEGKVIQVWFNGEQVMRYEEKEEGIDRIGNICLQIHSGPPSEASYRNIKIKTL